jgi:hypothetical protein
VRRDKLLSRLTEGVVTILDPWHVVSIYWTESLGIVCFWRLTLMSASFVAYSNNQASAKIRIADATQKIVKKWVNVTLDRANMIQRTIRLYQ